MSDPSQQTSLFEVTGKTVTVWTDATGERQHKDNASDGYGCVVKCEGSDEWEEIQGEIEYDGHPTAHVAKYKAIINGVEYVRDEYSGVGFVQVYNDAEVPVEQIDGSSDTNEPHLQKLKREARRLLCDFDDWDIDWRGETQSREIRRANELAKDATRGGTQ
jgi:ribonuclease HI